MVVHSPEKDLGAIGEPAIECGKSVVPLARSPGPIPLGAQMLSEHRVGVVDGHAGLFDVEEGPSGVQHRAAGHAHCRHGAAGDVGVGKGAATGGELIQVRRVNRRVAEGGHSVETLIVGEEEEDVGTVHEAIP